MAKHTFDSNCNKGNHRGIIGIIGAVLGGIVMAVLFAFLFGLIVKLLWNALMPGLFGFSQITYWQAVGLVILAKLLFGGFRHHQDFHPRGHSRNKTGRTWRWPMRDGEEGQEDDEELWQPGGSYRDRKHYERYWKEEGKAAFEDYLKRIEAKEKSE